MSMDNELLPMELTMFGRFTAHRQVGAWMLLWEKLSEEEMAKLCESFGPPSECQMRDAVRRMITLADAPREELRGALRALPKLHSIDQLIYMFLTNAVNWGLPKDPRCCE